MLEKVLPVARAAGDGHGGVRDRLSVRGKDDASPVTAADEMAEALILPALAALAPDIPVVAEERCRGQDSRGGCTLLAGGPA